MLPYPCWCVRLQGNKSFTKDCKLVDVLNYKVIRAQQKIVNLFDVLNYKVIRALQKIVNLFDVLNYKVIRALQKIVNSLQHYLGALTCWEKSSIGKTHVLGFCPLVV